MDFETASWKSRILFSFVKRPWNGYNKIMMTLSTEWIYVTIPNIVNIKILKDSVRYVSLQTGNLTAHQCWAQTKLMWIWQAKPLLWGPNCNDIFYPEHAGTEYSSFSYLFASCSEHSSIYPVITEREGHPSFGVWTRMVSEDCFVDWLEATAL